jgi:tRNA (mo5U34)-methyltransferase
MDTDELRSQVSTIKWWHQIDLGNEVITPGLVCCRRQVEKLGLAEDLSGLTVLDIGAWDGYYAFEAERRGAKRVLAVDSFCWDGGGWGTKKGFDLARKALHSKVEDKWIEVLDLSPKTVGVFDLVLFLGVLYHLRHPLLALEKVFSVTGKQLILETHVDLCSTGKPVMRFYPGTELSGDPTNWWGPNPEAVIAMLKDVGFRKVEMVRKSLGISRRFSEALYHKIVTKRPDVFSDMIQQEREVFHAFR